MKIEIEVNENWYPAKRFIANDEKSEIFAVIFDEKNDEKTIKRGFASPTHDGAYVFIFEELGREKGIFWSDVIEWFYVDEALLHYYKGKL